MDTIIKINHRQFAWMTGTVLSSASMLVMPQETILIAGNDAWFSVGLSCLYCFLLAYAFSLLIKWYPGKNLFEIAFIALGRRAGGIFNFLTVLYIWLIFLRDQRLFSNFIGTTLLQNTPEEVIILLMVLVVVYYGSAGVEVTARINDIFFPISLLAAWFLPFLLMNELNLEYLEPVLASGPWRILASGALNIGWFGDLFIMGAFLHTISDARQFRVSLHHGIALSLFALSLLLFLAIGVLGDQTAGRTTYLHYTLFEQIHLTDFLDRLEIVLFSLWFPAFLLKSAFFYNALLTGVSSFAGTRQPQFYSRPLCIFTFFSIVLSFQSLEETMIFAKYASAGLVLLFQPLALLFLLTASKRKKKTKVPHQPNDHREGKERGRGRIPGTTKMALPLSFVLLLWVGTGLGKDFPLAATLCAIAYGAVLLALSFVTYVEVKNSHGK